MFLLYRNLVQTFHFGYSSNLYTGFWNRLSSLSIGYDVFIQTFGADFPVWLQFQFVYRLLVQTFFPVWLLAMLFLYRHFVQTIQFVYSSSLYTGFCYRLSSLVIGYVGIIQTFGTDFPVRLQFQFVYWLLPQTFFPVWLQAMLFLYRHLVETFQFGNSSSLYISIWYRLSFQFCYRQCCFYIDIWYRLSSLPIVPVCIQAIGIDIPVWLQTMFLLYRNLVQTFHFGYSSNLYTCFWNRLSSLVIG